MKGHLSAEALMDVLDGTGASGARAHVGGCALCRSRLREAEEALSLALGTEVPEPPPLYWEALRRNVRRRVSEEPRSRWGLGWLLPLAAAVALVVAVRVGHAPAPSPQPPLTLPAWSALPPETGDAGLAALGEVVTTDGEAVSWDDGKGPAAFVADLSDEDASTLVQMLRAESAGVGL
jgi:hypothetical protein